ncbi:leucine-rich repeat domain-containing protein [Marinilabiliaceae bacterium JC017]|nr:leucine-rich repeat domain-containing protein [Marinilabiliaceae bacterium JC017]
MKHISSHIIKMSVLLWLFVFLGIVTLRAQYEYVYIIQDEDVVVEDGIIVSCYYDFSIKDIVIPEILDEQTVIGIKSQMSNMMNSFFNKDLTSIKLPSTITLIGEYAFASNRLTKVEIPEGVECIERYAFAKNHIHTLCIPVNVKEINGGSFSENAITTINGKASKGFIFGSTPNGLVDYSVIRDYGGSSNVIDFIPSTVKTIGSYAFSMNGIVEVHIPSSVTRIEQNAFRRNGLTSLTLGKNINFLGNNCFCFNQLNTVMIAGDIAHMGERIFSHNNITKLVLPDRFDTIPTRFCEQNELKELVISANVKVIKQEAFVRNKLINVKLNAELEEIGKAAFYLNKISKLSLPDNVQFIRDNAFGRNQITEVDLPEKLLFLGAKVFGRSCINHLTLPLPQDTSFIDWRQPYNRTSYKGGAMITDFEKSYEAQFWYHLTKDDVVFEDGEIRNCYCRNQKNIIIPDSLDGRCVIEIGSNAFKGMELYNVKLPRFLTRISSAAFQGNFISHIDLPSGLVYVENRAFLDTYLDSIKLPTGSNNEIISWSFENQTFKGGDVVEYPYRELEALFWKYVDSTEVRIVDNVIENYDGDQDYLIIPDTIDGQQIMGIGCGAFRGESLKGIKLPKDLVFIDKNAFKGNHLTEVIFPKKLDRIGEYAFYDNDIKVIQMPGKISFIGVCAFALNELKAIRLTGVADKKYNWIDSEGNIYQVETLFDKFNLSLKAVPAKN